MEEQHIVLAHHNDLDQPAYWCIYTGPESLRPAKKRARQLQREGWEYVAIRPVGRQLVVL
jgi:hypothetical protein